MVALPSPKQLRERTRALPVVRGKTCFVTRRCAGRLRLLRPDADTTAIVRYVLFHGASRYGIRIHAACFNTTHFHLVLTDPDGLLPRFMQYLDSVLGRALNHRWGRSGAHFWGPGSYTRVEITSYEELLRALAYTTANPVKDGLVSSPGRWPGLNTLPAQVGTVLAARRPPTAFFGGKPAQGATPSRSRLPLRVELEVSVPTPFVPRAELDRYRRDYQEALDAAVARFRQDRPRCMGPSRLRSLDPFTPAGPVEATFSRPARVYAEPAFRHHERQELHAWQAAYLTALDRWCADDPTARFPEGTWFLHQHYEAPVLNSDTAP